MVHILQFKAQIFFICFINIKKKNINIHILIIRIAAMCTYPVQPVCTSLSSLLFILLFIKSQYTVFAHLTCFCTSYLSCRSCFALFFIPLHFLLFIPLFYLYICYCVVLLLYNFYSLHCPLSGPDLIYISLLIIPCIIYYVTNKETLNLEIKTFHN